MPSIPPVIATPPTAPSRSSPSTFATLADAWVAWLESEATDIGSAADASYNNASESYANAVSAQAAASGVSAALWVSGSNYAVGDVRRSVANGYPYRCILTATGRTTDPNADPSYWVLAALFTPAMYVVSAISETAVAWGHYILTNASATTLTLPAAPLVGDVVWVTTANARVDNVVARNALNIMSLAENMTLNDPNATVQLRYASVALGWRIT